MSRKPWYDRVRCNICNAIMDRDGNAYRCPKCGATAILEDDEDEQYGIYYECEPREERDFFSEIPSGCLACGGPYPDCISSCNLESD